MINAFIHLGTRALIICGILIMSLPPVVGFEMDRPNSIQECRALVPTEQWPDTCDGLESP